MPVTSLLRDGPLRLERNWLLTRPHVTPRSVAGACGSRGCGASATANRTEVELRERQLIGTNMTKVSPPSERVLWPRCAGLVSSTSSTLPGGSWATDPSEVSTS